MRIGCLRVYFQIPESHSLKHKRRVLRSLKDKLFSQFNVAVAEIGSNDKLQVGEIGVVTISNESRHCQSMLQKALNLIEDRGEDIVVLEADIEIL